MVAQVFEVYGALCLFAFVGFLGLAAVAKLRPDLEEEGFDPAGIDFAELEKLKKLVSPRDALSIEPPIMEEPFWSPPPRRARAERASHQKASTTLL
jgi:hypothetical protein